MKRVFPVHALRDKGFQRHEGIGPQVSSQQQRAALVPADKPRINRGSNADRVPRFGLHRNQYVRALEETPQTPVFANLGDANASFSGRLDWSAPSRPVGPLPGRPPLIGPICAASPPPAPSRPNPACFALTHTARGMFGFLFDRSTQKPGHTTGGMDGTGEMGGSDGTGGRGTPDVY